jgi:hypothetical protein
MKGIRIELDKIYPKNILLFSKKSVLSQRKTQNTTKKVLIAISARLKDETQNHCYFHSQKIVLSYVLRNRYCNARSLETVPLVG